MTSSTDKLGMSLDEIIKLNKKKHGGGTGSVISRGTQQSRSTRGGNGNRNYQNNTNTASARDRFRSWGRRFNQVPYRNQFWTNKKGKFNGQGPLLKRYGSAASYAGSNRGYGSFQGGLRYPGQRLARNRIRLATRTLNMRQKGRWQGLQYGNSGSVQGGYKSLPTRRGFRGLPLKQRRGLYANQSMKNSLHSDQIIRLQKQQTIQQKLNQARALRSGQSVDKNLVTGSSDMLTVCIANDMAAKRRGRKQYASIFKKFIGNNFIGSSFNRRSKNNYLGNQSVAPKGGSSSVVDILPEDSIVTTISRYNRASSGDQNRQAEPVITGVRQNRAVDS